VSDGKRILEKGIVGRGIDDSHVVVEAAVGVGDSCNGRDAIVTRGAQSNLRKRLWNRVVHINVVIGIRPGYLSTHTMVVREFLNSMIITRVCITS